MNMLDRYTQAVKQTIFLYTNEIKIAFYFNSLNSKDNEGYSLQIFYLYPDGETPILWKSCQCRKT